MNVSDISGDALGDLARATIAVAAGTRVQQFYWLDEPGAHKWMLERLDDHVNVSIRYIEDAMVEGIDENVAPVVFVATPALSDLIGLICGLLERVLDEYGDTGYRLKWMSDAFPHAELSKLRRLADRAG